MRFMPRFDEVGGDVYVTTDGGKVQGSVGLVIEVRVTEELGVVTDDALH